jgi:hypothetical protein
MPVKPANSRRVPLSCHPALPSRTIHSVDAIISVNESNGVTLTYLVVANTEQPRIPAAAAPRWVNGLWQRICFEAFVGIKGSPAYYEFNFSPSREWAAYAFRGYRDGEPIEDEDLAPVISVRKSGETLELKAVVHLDRLPLIQPGIVITLGLSAVIEDADGRLSYWALKHPVEKPDFHHADSFALEFALPLESA